MILLVLVVLTALPASASNCLAFSNGFAGFESGNLYADGMSSDRQVSPVLIPPPTGNYQVVLNSGGTKLEEPAPLGDLGTDIAEFACWVPPCAPSWHILSSYSRQYNPLLPGYGSSGHIFSASAIKSSITANAGDTLSFRWNFISGESNDPDYVDYGYYNDTAFFAIGPNGYEIASTLSPYLAYPNPPLSGYRTLTHRITQSGTFDLMFGVANISDARGTSYLLLDDIALMRPVPEPSEWILLTTVGAVLAYVIVRRRRARELTT